MGEFTFQGGKSVDTIRTQVKPNAQMPKLGKPRRSHLKRQRRNALVISLCALTTIACLLTATNSSSLATFLTSLGSPSSNSEPKEDRIGTIILEHDDSRCQQMKFDNDSGRTVEDALPCENKVVLDAHGVRVPQGTVHRLDAISKSFFGR